MTEVNEFADMFGASENVNAEPKTEEGKVLPEEEQEPTGEEGQETASEEGEDGAGAAEGNDTRDDGNEESSDEESSDGESEGEGEGEGNDAEGAGDDAEGEPDTSKLDELIKQNNELRDRLDALDKEKADKIDADAEAEAEKKISELSPIDVSELVSDEDYEKAMTDKAGLNTILQKVAVKTRQSTIEQVSKSMPNMVNKMVYGSVSLYFGAEDMFRAHPKLREQRDKVGEIANKLKADNPNWSNARLFQELPIEAKKQLKIKEEAPPKKKPIKKKRFVARTTPTRKGASIAPEGIGAEIAAMEDAR